jgi:cytosine/adenosine deaminase-related metal-dependent hydrolase
VVAAPHVAYAEWLGRPERVPAVLHAQRPDAGTIDIGPVLAFPGLVNSHDHLEFNCYSPLGIPSYADFTEWSSDIHRCHSDLIASVESIPRTVRLKVGALKNLLSGVTSVAHHGTKLPADLQLPIRVISNFDSIHSPENEPNGRREFFKPWRRRPVVLHMAESTTAESRTRALAFMRWNAFGRRVIGVHGVALKDEDFSKLEALVWCPASNLFLLGRTADVAIAKENTVILFGTDSTLSAAGTIWDHLRLARELGGLSDAELLNALTDGAGRAWQLESSDFVVAKRRQSDRWGAFFAITPADILLVVRDGQVVVAGEEIVDACPEMSADLAFFDVGNWRTWIRMDIESLEAGFESRACYADFTSTMRRLIGAV